MCTQSTTYTTTTSSTVGYTAMTSSGNEIHLTVKDAEMSNVDMVGLMHEISNSTYTSCNCLTGTNDWEIKASTWVGGLRANNNNFTLAIIDGTGNVLATQTAQTNGNITALTYLSVKATGLGTGPYYAVISYNKNSGSGDGFLNMHGWTLRIREDVPTTEAVVESNAFSFQPGYRFGFNGMERDDEIKGIGNSYTTEFRLLDPRLGRWMSTDPVVHPGMSPYNTFDNNPIYWIDPWGSNVDGYEDSDGNYVWHDDHQEESFTDDNGTTWNKVSDDKEAWDEAITIREANLKALSDLGFDAEQAKKDVKLYDGSNSLFTKFSKLENESNYTGCWSCTMNSERMFEDYDNKDAAETGEINGSGFALKWYPDKGGQVNASAIGLVRTGYFEHRIEAALELGETVINSGLDKMGQKPENEDWLKDMHRENAEEYLNTD